MIEEERLAENAARLEPILQRELSSLDPSLATIVRGKGLFYAVVIKPQGGRSYIVSSWGAPAPAGILLFLFWLWKFPHKIWYRADI